MNKTNKHPSEIQTIPLDFQEYPLEEIQSRALKYFQIMNKRRTIRDFSTSEVPINVIENRFAEIIT